MPYYLLLSRSVTHAQKMSAALQRAGIRAGYGRAPMSLSSRGCAYALRVSAGAYSTAAAQLSRQGLRPVGVYYDGGDGVYREIAGF